MKLNLYEYILLSTRQFLFSHLSYHKFLSVLLKDNFSGTSKAVLPGQKGDTQKYFNFSVNLQNMAWYDYQSKNWI